ncbi:restriction endonuclease subunit S [Nitrincola sp.]|uniref:restriction endonuclease subunit S n=1 Tax=Nitrincola sp. TaxID=1926584 RepID=UPI003A9320C6
MLPESWGVMRLDDISEKVMVGIASAATHAYSDSGIRMLRNLNIKEGWIDDSDILYVNSSYEKAFRNKRLKQGDILTVRTGYPGVSAVVPMKYEGAQCFTSLITRLDQHKAFPDFVCRYINSEYGKKFITSGEAGGAQKNVNAGMLKRMVIPLPPIPEQKKIAQILSTWDNVISATEQLLENSQQRKKALMQQLLTGKKRLPGFEGEWNVNKLEAVMKRIYGGGTPPREDISCWNGDLPWVTVKDLVSDRITGAQEHISDEGLRNSAANIVEKGNVIIATRMAVGRVVTCSVDVAINQDLKAIIPNEKAVPDYIFYWFKYKESEISKLGTGSTVKGIQLSDLKKLTFLTPPISEQKKIAEILTTADKEIDALQKRLGHLKQEKKALMQQLLTGKRRVQVDAAA